MRRRRQPNRAKLNQQTKAINYYFPRGDMRAQNAGVIWPEGQSTASPECDFEPFHTLREEAAVNGDFVRSSETRFVVQESNAGVDRADVIYGLESASSLVCICRNSSEHPGTQSDSTQQMIYSDTNSVQGVSHNAIYSLQPD